MKIIKEYRDYLNDIPKGFWFRRKLYGWGWTPATWQGWLVTLIYIVLILGFAFTTKNNANLHESKFKFMLPIILLTLSFIFIAYKKGESPRWQWGKRK